MIIGPIKLDFRIMGNEGPAIGPGKALVMEAIDKSGSISAAGRALGMSYRRIWLLADSLNRNWREPVFVTMAGGGKDGGTRLTAFGRELLSAYRTIEQRMMTAAEGQDLEWLVDARHLHATQA